MTNEIEYIVKETWLPNGVKTEKVGELVRCGQCRFATEDRFTGKIWCCDQPRTPEWFCADGRGE